MSQKKSGPLILLTGVNFFVTYATGVLLARSSFHRPLPHSATTSVIDEDLPHRERGGTMEVAVIVPLRPPGEAQVRLVHERGRLQSVVARLPAEVSLRQPAQLLIDLGPKRIRGAGRGVGGSVLVGDHRG